MSVAELVSFGLRQVPLLGACEHGNELKRSIKEFLPAREYTRFTPAQHLRNCRVQRPSNHTDLDSNEAGAVYFTRSWICFRFHSIQFLTEGCASWSQKQNSVWPMPCLNQKARLAPTERVR
jgi:hypothetical protein